MNLHKYRQVDIGTSSHTGRQTKSQVVTYRDRHLGRQIYRQVDIPTVTEAGRHMDKQVDENKCRLTGT